ncbi:hypothetical protein [Palleronia rufa]|uniref:hypothetical protein n=1 Tax=Palleronia rufa TaxID=1530186 RepID=UPI00055A6A59|nr:hypothetical protein [Palleronia rufa]
MSSILLFAAGTLLLVAVVYDFLHTTISLSGLGPISARLTRWLWGLGRGITLWTENRFGRSLRGVIGPTILSVLAGSWILLHLAGYTLLYLSGTSLEVSKTGAPADFVQIVAFAGSALSTLGASTVGPTNGWWDILSMVAAINGMVVLTLSVSFVLTILQTTASARSWAVRYHALIESAETRGEEKTPGTAASLGAELCTVAVSLTASPLTGVFVPDDPDMSFPQALRDLCVRMDGHEMASWNPGIGSSELAEMRSGLGLLGRHVGTHGEEGDFANARAWAERHSLPPRL